ncbi:multidrug resistance efflux pump [Bradyrhizobium sp. LM3.2]
MTVHTNPSKSEAVVIPGDALEGILPATQSPARTRKLNLRKLLLAGAAAAALAGASWYGYDYWTVGRFLVSTDDAYVKADSTTIAPKVSGYLDRVLIGDNEHVKAGQVLARIDDRDFKVALDQANGPTSLPPMQR